MRVSKRSFCSLHVSMVNSNNGGQKLRLTLSGTIVYLFLNGCCILLRQSKGGVRKGSIGQEVVRKSNRHGDEHAEIEFGPASAGVTFEPNFCRVGWTQRNDVFGNDDAIVWDVVICFVQFGFDSGYAHPTAAATSSPPVASQLPVAEQFSIDAAFGIAESFVDDVVGDSSFDRLSSAAATTIGDDVHVGLCVDVASPPGQDAHFA